MPGYGGEHRIVITRDGAMDELVVRIEIAAEHASRGAAAHDALRDEAVRRLQKMLGLRSKIEIVAPGTFPRTDFKARRVIDDREVFRDMNARLAGRRRDGLHPVARSRAARARAATCARSRGC